MINRERLFKETLESDLFQECVAGLSDVKILDLAETDKQFDTFEEELPILSWGKIDWNSILQKIQLERAGEIIPSLKKLLGKKTIDQAVYILWGEASIPAIKTNLSSVVTVFNDVISVAPDTWLVNFEEGYVVEIFHDGQMTAGLIPKDV